MDLGGRIDSPRKWTVLVFAMLVVFSWANEVLDLPAVFLGAPRTPVNWRESVIETVVLVATGLLVHRLARSWELQRRHLSGLHVICAQCKAVRDGDRWLRLETWLTRRSEAVLSHGLCPRCLREASPEVYEEMRREGLLAAGPDDEPHGTSPG